MPFEEVKNHRVDVSSEVDTVYQLLYDCKQFVVILLYSLSHQSWDTSVFIRFIYHFRGKK